MISTLNSNLTPFTNMFTIAKQANNSTACVGIQVISASANTSTGCTVTLTNTIQYNALVALVFSRYGIYAFEADCNSNKEYTTIRKSTLLGSTDAHTVEISTSNKTEITIKTGSWEKCVMLVTAQSGRIYYSFS